MLEHDMVSLDAINLTGQQVSVLNVSKKRLTGSSLQGQRFTMLTSSRQSAVPKFCLYSTTAKSLDIFMMFTHLPFHARPSHAPTRNEALHQQLQQLYLHLDSLTTSSINNRC